ncbi:hypothetical protein [Methanosarcina barkeri]|uniref:hypothetical protein n=1 Tax=Methanosarcina barkeri TaxID=2208 RepID=UPI00064EC113|nr:hypothetical protein [Methanosarcina barkeri]
MQAKKKGKNNLKMIKRLIYFGSFNALEQFETTIFSEIEFIPKTSSLLNQQKFQNYIPLQEIQETV